MSDTLAPLEDDTYEPFYRPVNGKPNPIVAKWGPRSQRRWFRRFWGSPEMPTVVPSEVTNLYVESEEHKGVCCSTCHEDADLGYDYTDGCCCRSTRTVP